MKLLFLIIGFGVFFSASAQKPFYFLDGKSDTVWLDTLSLDGVEDLGHPKHVINLGNFGSPEFSLLPDYTDAKGNDYTFLAGLGSVYNRRFSVYRPVTEVKYALGSKQEQHFNVYHTQNISSKTNFSIGLDKINSQGLYLNQNTNQTNVYLNAYSKGLGKLKYNFQFDGNYLDFSSSLNGGLAEDSVFINDTLDIRNRELLDVNLLHAYQDNKYWRGDYEHSIALQENWDSTGQGSALRVYHQMGFRSAARTYYDSILNTDFYDAILLDSNLTTDGLNYQQMKTALGLSFEQQKAALISVKAGVTPSLNRFRHNGLDTNVLDLNAQATVRFETGKWKSSVAFDYLLNDQYAQNDYDLDIAVSYALNKANAFFVEVNTFRDRPQLDLLNYQSNHRGWKNSFEKQEMLHAGIAYTLQRKWELTARVDYQDLKNPIYFGYDKTPAQVMGIGQIIRTSLKGEGKLGERWTAALHGAYQYTGGYDVFRVPALFVNAKFYYGFKAFKKKMDVAIGADLTYFSRYDSKNFDPVSGQFYIASNQEVGGYPYADVFLKGRIQRATFFLMMSHPHQGLLGYDYFYFPNYPANDRFFRLGISWMFLN